MYCFPAGTVYSHIKKIKNHTIAGKQSPTGHPNLVISGQHCEKQIFTLQIHHHKQCLRCILAKAGSKMMGISVHYQTLH